MVITLGKLNIVPAKNSLELIAPPVFKAISSLSDSGSIGVAEIDPGLSDTAAFCENYGVRMDQSANCVILEAKRADRNWFAACVILGSTRADINGLARHTLDARRVSFAPMDQAVAQSGMEYGAITPIGLPDTWSILIDKAVTETEYVVIGSGVRKSKLILPGKLFSQLKNILVLENLGRTANS